MCPRDSHILVVDDSGTIRRVIVEGLQRLGFKKITPAENAMVAMETLESLKGTPDAVALLLSDVNMPGVSGMDFLKQVRAKPEFGKLPFLLVTTESEKASIIDAAMSGVSGYVVKPFNIDTLVKRIDEAWKKHNG